MVPVLLSLSSVHCRPISTDILRGLCYCPLQQGCRSYINFVWDSLSECRQNADVTSLKKKKSERWVKTQILEKWETVLFSEMRRIHSLDESRRDQKDCMYWPEWNPLISVEWLLLASTTSIEPTEWIYVIISSRASLVLCHGLVLLAVAYFHIYFQEPNVIFQLGFQSFKISFPNHNAVLHIFPLSLSVLWKLVHPPA